MPEGKGTVGSATAAERRDEGATGEKRTIEDLADEVRLLGVGRVGRPALGALRERLLHVGEALHLFAVHGWGGVSLDIGRISGNLVSLHHTTTTFCGELRCFNNCQCT